MTFEVGLTEFTGSILADTYEVNSLEEYDTWFDVRYREHRNYQRNRISGSFDMLFMTINDYNEFRNALLSARDGRTGAYKLKLSVNNTLELSEGYFYVDFELNRVQKAPRIDAFGSFKVTIKER